ncbi:MAG: hypothetical protein KQI35_10615 [Bacteroidetes bacterium]|nr:hypothetical protein [Bacteroidota bacterium]
MKLYFIGILLIVLPFFTLGQEYLTGIGGNGVIKKFQKQHQQNHIPLKSKFLSILPLDLPFYDDFSIMTVYPDTNRWIDNEAFINSTFAYFPINYGVATLDVIDANGNIYPEATPFTFLADRLTSKPIRLDSVYDPAAQAMKKLTPADSVYFSFYYQPQGLGDYPLDYDSLVLEFGLYNGDTVFSHYDSVTVFGYEYFDDPEEYYPPKVSILPPLSCDPIWYQLKDTLFYNDSVRIPCDSVLVYDTKWDFIWSAKGDSLDVFLDSTDAFFKYVVIPIEDTAYFRNDFQFRFKNFGSISNINSWKSNTDQWHLDMVRLDWNRKKLDKYRREVSFTLDAPGFIQDFSSMPYKHYAGNITGLKKDSISLYVNNLDSVNHTYQYDYFVQNAAGDTLPAFEYDGFTGMLNSVYAQDVFDYQPFVNPKVTYFYTSQSEDTADFRITHVIRDSDLPDNGDTLVYNQQFRNYLAYDDGTAESGYGLSPGGAKLAVRFRTEDVDTLRGVKMYFNKTLGNENDRLFHITVWNDNDGIPGDTLMVQLNERPAFTDGLNRYHTFIFDRYVKLGVQSFFIGWTQTSNDNLNIGFDRNTNARSKNYYNVDGSWVNSSFEGAIMIRPILGKALGDDLPDSKSTPVDDLAIHPNPPIGTNQIYVGLPKASSDPAIRNYLNLRVVDLYGRVVISGPYTDRINIDFLKKGLYIVNLHDAAQALHYSTKLLIVK